MRDFIALAFVIYLGKVAYSLYADITLDDIGCVIYFNVTSAPEIEVLVVIENKVELF